MTNRTFLPTLISFLTLAWLPAAALSANALQASQRTEAQNLHNQGNFKDAYDKFLPLCLDPSNTAAKIDFDYALLCLQRLDRIKDLDDFRESVVRAQSNQWQILHAVANSYVQDSHEGFVIAGKFERGPQRGGGEAANVADRDRVRALQLMQQAMPMATADGKSWMTRSFFDSFASALLRHRGQIQAWRLQELTDITVLPDWEPGYSYNASHGASLAPVDPNGDPVFYKVPESYESAACDGERWRWLLAQAVTMDPSYADEAASQWARFLREQFGVQTMAFYSWFKEQDSGESTNAGPFAVHTLADDETIARLAGGVKRFKLAPEFNYIAILKNLATKKNGYSEYAMNELAEEYENRRQFSAAERWWTRNIAAYGAADGRAWKQKRLDQITDNWGQFEPHMTRPAGKSATLEYRFRNGERVRFEAHRIDVKRLLNDVREYLDSNPRELEHEKMNIQDIGSRIVHQKGDKYVTDKVRSWTMDLSPLPNHFDRRVSVDTGLTKAGAYMLTARLANGNESKIVVWIDDSAIVCKPLDGNNMAYFVMDAVTGAPVAGQEVRFFGFYQKYLDPKLPLMRRYDIITKQFTRKTDASGQITISNEETIDKDRNHHSYTWLITTQDASGRLAYHGFDNVWSHGNYYDQEYSQWKVYGITDRPVYRPAQPVQYKLWINQAQYDKEGASSYAGRSITVELRNPRGEGIYSQTVTADAYGGVAGTWTIPTDAPLGIYRLQIQNMGQGCTFRIEEYKKPEFEVKVEAPADPVMLGDTITATVQAKYYFGAPVAKGKIKYKVQRSAHDSRWFPNDPWDWFYGPGYWWFAYDYDWYPGWHHWGCMRPYGSWWTPPQVPPELVAEGEAPLQPDGTFKLTIDSAVAKAVHGNQDHRYEITAEVTDESRRVIVGQGTVLVARKPFSVYVWVDRGQYRAGDTVQAGFSARTLDSKPVSGNGQLVLYRVTYTNAQPVEKAINEWSLDPNDQGMAQQQLKASEPGQFRLSYKVTDKAGHAIEGGYVFTVIGSERDSAAFHFNALELVPDKKTYQPDDTVELQINTDAADSTVLLFIRPANGIYLQPKILRFKGKSASEKIRVTKKDMPNFFIEALTVRDGKVHTETREIAVPPEKRILNVDVLPSKSAYKPGENASIKVRLTDITGEPYSGSTVISVYDRSVEYIAGGSNIPEIKAFFWKWRRNHTPYTQTSLGRRFSNMNLPNALGMNPIGIFGGVMDPTSGEDVDDDGITDIVTVGGYGARSVMKRKGLADFTFAPQADRMAAAPSATMAALEEKREVSNEPSGTPASQPETKPTVRSQFADTAFWIAALQTDVKGEAEVSFKMPENLTGWKIRTWAMGHGTRVGEATTEAVTVKNLLLRLQAPRFFVEKDEVVLSANIHNYLKSNKAVRAVLEMDGGCLELMDATTSNRVVTVNSNDEQRVDWRVKVVREGEAVIRMKALTDEESDAMEMRFPVYVHGFLKTEPFSGVVRPTASNALVKIRVPAERRIEQSALEIRYSPTLAGAMVDALPYLVDYPYGCTEQTLNKFLPTVMTQKILREMGLNLKTIQAKRTNLNAQELGDDKTRAAQWQRRYTHSPVFDEQEVGQMVKTGVDRLTAMQLTDGGWGWFSGWGEQSYPHTTAYVLHGLQIARDNDVTIAANVLDRGTAWLERYQDEQLTLLKNFGSKMPWKQHWKEYADDLDAFIYMVLVDAGKDNATMREFLYRDRLNLAMYGKTMFGIALQKTNRKEELAMLMRNIEQFLVEDAENQTAYLNLNNGGYWWCWYGSEFEAQAYYLKLLARTAPKSAKAAGLVKYLLNNRKNATYWNSTRDTALCIEAMADYIRASGEDKPDMTVEILIDGTLHKSVPINAENLFSYDNRLLLTGKDVPSGEHTIEVRRQGKGPVYFNAYLTTFTLEDSIKKAGLEVKVDRRFFKLVPEDKKTTVAGSRGQVVRQKVEKYRREPLADLASLKSGDLLEVELVVESKNDYEYLIIEDKKPAGFEPVDVRSGYNGNPMGAYVEFRDERVCFFLRTLARGTHSVSYRTRAEIPGKFSALPAKIYGMYAPELVGNADEIKLRIED